MQMNENRRESLPAPWLALGAGVACAALWVLGYMGGLGVGMTASSLLILGVGMYLCRRQICWRADCILLLTLAVLLSLAYGIFGSLAMQIFNLPVLCLLLSQSLLALAGHCPEGALSAAGLSSGIREALGSLFRHWGVPFRTVKERQGSASALRGLGMGLLIAVPLLAVVLFLLAWADTVFSSLLSGLFVSEDPLSAFWNVLWRLIKLLAIALLVFSCLYTLLLPRRERAAKERFPWPITACAMVLALLCLAYAAFVYVQVRYLFGGAETAAMADGYAQYARTGFFQLVAVAVINLIAAQTSLIRCGESRVVRALSALMSLLTAVILASAFWRMRLYIQAFGLSTLRLLTLWGMAMIALLLALTLIKCARPGVRICTLACAVMLSSYVLLNYINVDRTIARWNLRAYENGKQETLDTEYLAGLSPDVLAAPWQVEQLDAIRKQQSERRPDWFAWSLSWLRVGEK